jgi:hypothetical protein
VTRIIKIARMCLLMDAWNDVEAGISKSIHPYGRQRQPEIGVAAQPDGPAEPDHAGRRRAAGPGQLGDAPPGHALRIVEDRLRHAALDRRQVRQQRPDGDQDPGVSPGLGSRLMFGHAARLPVSVVKSVLVWCLPICRKQVDPF